jgi:ribosomal protein S18 acetylase RimI-like enzyme
MDGPDFRKLTLSELDQAVEVISQAFINDPLCVFMLPNKRTRLKTLKKFFHAYGTIYIGNGRGYGVGEPLKGVAFWMQPSQQDLSLSIKSLSIFVPIVFTYYPIGYMRARAILKQTELLHQKYANEPHYYLDNLAVLPVEQGKGYSSQLMRPILERANAERVVAYTDTVTRANVPLYEHFGFQVMEECLVDGTGITVWSLKRSPHTKSGE